MAPSFNPEILGVLNAYILPISRNVGGAIAPPSSTAPVLTGSLLEGCKGCSYTLPLLKHLLTVAMEVNPAGKIYISYEKISK